MPRRHEPDGRYELSEEMRLRAHKWVEDAAIAQGVSPKVTDPLTIRKILIVFGWLDTDGRPLR